MGGRLAISTSTALAAPGAESPNCHTASATAAPVTRSHVACSLIDIPLAHNAQLQGRLGVNDGQELAYCERNHRSHLESSVDPGMLNHHLLARQHGDAFSSHFGRVACCFFLSTRRRTWSLATSLPFQARSPELFHHHIQ
jgi:hypothetical protein